MGPEGSPYQVRLPPSNPYKLLLRVVVHCTVQGGVFKLEVSIPERYPLEPPQMRFLQILLTVDEAAKE